MMSYTDSIPYTTTTKNGVMCVCTSMYVWCKCVCVCVHAQSSQIVFSRTAKAHPKSILCEDRISFFRNSTFIESKLCTMNTLSKKTCVPKQTSMNMKSCTYHHYQ